MKHDLTHVLYEWEPLIQLPFGGDLHTFSQGYHSQIIHRADDPLKFNIPVNAVVTPVWYSSYLDRWMLSNGRELHLPHKLS